MEKKGQPALNVKVYHFPFTTEEIVQKFNCSEEQAEKAIQFAFEAVQSRFWDDEAPRICKEILGTKKVWSEGRSGGWLVVGGLPPVEDWHDDLRNNWAEFETKIEDTIKQLLAGIPDDIEHNKWHLRGAEMYNFIELNGETICIAELKEKARKAGFGPVIR